MKKFKLTKKVLNVKNNVKLKKNSNFYKYFIFLTFLHSKFKNISFKDAAKSLSKHDIYNKLYFSNYFHELGTSIFKNQLFKYKDISYKSFKLLLDEFWILLEKDAWFANNRSSSLFRNISPLDSEKWYLNMKIFLLQNYKFLNIVFRIFKEESNDMFIFTTGLLTEKK